jgi:hypothetical protein
MPASDPKRTSMPDGVISLEVTNGYPRGRAEFTDGPTMAATSMQMADTNGLQSRLRKCPLQPPQERASAMLARD